MAASVSNSEQHEGSREYELPASGGAEAGAEASVITVGSERFRCAEALFQPGLPDAVPGSDVNPLPGIHHCLRDTMDAHWKILEEERIGETRGPWDAEYDDDGDLSKRASIVLCGGTSCIPGMPQRLGKVSCQLVCIIQCFPIPSLSVLRPFRLHLITHPLLTRSCMTLLVRM